MRAPALPFSKRRQPGYFGEGRVFAVEIALHVSHNLWTTWAKLAIAHESDARQARAEGLRSGEPDAYVPEFNSSLQAVTQVAFALDAWFGATYPTLYGGKARPPHAMSPTQLTAFHAGSLAADIEWLFTSRGDAVHHQLKMTPGAEHPLAPANVPVEYVEFSADAAARALRMLKAVFEGDPRYAETGSWPLAGEQPRTHAEHSRPDDGSRVAIDTTCPDIWCRLDAASPT